ncbi:outer membrane protein [Erythrobacter litoralis]|uniref:TolC family outer membrane protein n=1 Tax=Erythrobacter litoralis TaxID=39960 RepID=UPI000863A046|nr:outer membrane protein [Erythrobacter litoralis]
MNRPRALPLRRALRRATCLAAFAGGLAAAPAQADTLREALAAAYNTNPTLAGARANQRATDEEVPIQRGQGLPNLNVTATHIEFIRQSANAFTAPERNLGVNAQLQVPIYQGGRIRNSTRAAEERVEAGQADLRGAESALFSQTVAAYMDVLRTEALAGLAANQVEVLDVTMQATRDRFEIGDTTLTDVAQAESRLALAQGDLRNALANLVSARETYIELVGKAPGNLQAPPPLPNLPDNVGTAVVTALENNPDLIAARQRAEAAGFDTEVAGSGRLPTVALFANGDYSDFYGTLGGPIAANFVQRETTANAGVRVTIPLFQGGVPAARQRQAGARESAALEQVIQTERNVISQTRAAYASWQASLAVIESSKTAVEAAELSLEGVRAENSIGNRTILDVLNAEQELVSARSQLVTARRNAYVAGFTLLATMGKAEARDLNLDTGGPLYDPTLNYERVRGRIWDWDRDPEPEPESTRTVDIPAPEATFGPVLESGER